MITPSTEGIREKNGNTRWLAVGKSETLNGLQDWDYKIFLQILWKIFSWNYKWILNAFMYETLSLVPERESEWLQEEFPMASKPFKCSPRRDAWDETLPCRCNSQSFLISAVQLLSSMGSFILLQLSVWFRNWCSLQSWQEKNQNSCAHPHTLNPLPYSGGLS